MKRYVEMLNGVERCVVTGPDKWSPVVAESSGITYRMLEDGEEWALPAPAPVAPAPMTQAEWDSIRRAQIERIEPEAQTRLLEAIAEKIGAAIPAEIQMIRAIRAADTPGAELPASR